MNRHDCDCEECKEFNRMGSIVTNWVIACLVLIVGIAGVILSADWVVGLFLK